MRFSLPMFARRHQVFLLVFFLLGILYFGTLRQGHDWGGDFSIYILQARNIVEHRAFDETSYVPTAESTRDHPAVYPPLTSLILAPVYGSFGLNYRAMKIVLVALLWCSIPFYYVLICRRGLHPAAAASIMLMFGLCPLVTMGKESVNSDNVFLFFAGATLLYLDFVYQRGWDEQRPFTTALTGALLLTLCYAARATGLALIGAVALHELWPPRRFRPFGLAVLALTGAAILAYTMFVFHVGKHYGTQFVFELRTYAEHAVFYLKSPAQIWAGAPAPLRYAAALVTVILSLPGFIGQLRRSTIIEPYVALSFAVLIPYVTANARYMMPLIPFVLMYAALGLMSLATRFSFPARTQKFAVAGCLLVALSASAMNLRTIETGPIKEGILQPTFQDVCSFLRDHTPANSLILSWNPRVFALYTNKASALYPQTGDEVGQFDAHIPAGYASVFLVYYRRELDERMLTPYFQANNARLHVVFENGDYRLYELPVAGSVAR
jgi:hypothetical protein